MKLQTREYTQSQYSITEDFSNISICTIEAQVKLIPTDDDQVTVDIYQNSKVPYAVKVVDGTLTVDFTDNRQWYDHIGIRIRPPKITVYLPDKAYGDVSVSTVTGDIKLQDMQVNSLDISVTTGDMELEGVRCAGELKARLTTGDMELTDVIAGTLTLTGKTGDVELDRCDADQLNIKTSTGDIEGTLLTDKVFIAKASTGPVRVPDTNRGGTCKLTTSTGNIHIRIYDKGA